MLPVEASVLSSFILSCTPNVPASFRPKAGSLATLTPLPACLEIPVASCLFSSPRSRSLASVRFHRFCAKQTATSTLFYRLAATSPGSGIEPRRLRFRSRHQRELHGRKVKHRLLH